MEYLILELHIIVQVVLRVRLILDRLRRLRLRINHLLLEVVVALLHFDDTLIRVLDLEPGGLDLFVAIFNFLLESFDVLFVFLFELPRVERLRLAGVARALRADLGLDFGVGTGGLF